VASRASSAEISELGHQLCSRVSIYSRDIRVIRHSKWQRNKTPHRDHILWRNRWKKSRKLDKQKMNQTAWYILKFMQDPKHLLILKQAQNIWNM